MPRRGGPRGRPGSEPGSEPSLEPSLEPSPKRNLEAIGERAAVAAVLARLAAAAQAVAAPGGSPLLVGPGDDAAALVLPPGEAAVITTDTLVEGVHFERSWTAPADLGFKLIGSAASDVGAMGARPRVAVVAVSAPGALGEAELLALTEGMIEAARASELALAGGDTTAGPLLVLTATILGSAPPAALRTRGGARPGDLLAVTGVLGEAAAGLLVLKEIGAGAPAPADTWLAPASPLDRLERRLRERGVAKRAARALAGAVRRFLRPSPPFAAGPLAAAAGATALIDISDGLASELRLMAEASGAGVMVDAGQVPVGAGARTVAAMHGGDPLVLALDGGEDYELLMAVPPARWEELASVLEAAGTPVTRIGEVMPRAAGLMLRDPTGHLRPLPEAGYEHFRAR